MRHSHTPPHQPYSSVVILVSWQWKYSRPFSHTFFSNRKIRSFLLLFLRLCISFGCHVCDWYVNCIHVKFSTYNPVICHSMSCTAFHLIWFHSNWYMKVDTKTVLRFINFFFASSVVAWFFLYLNDAVTFRYRIYHIDIRCWFCYMRIHFHIIRFQYPFVNWKRGFNETFFCSTYFLFLLVGTFFVGRFLMMGGGGPLLNPLTLFTRIILLTLLFQRSEPERPATDEKSK